MKSPRDSLRTSFTYRRFTIADRWTRRNSFGSSRCSSEVLVESGVSGHDGHRLLAAGAVTACRALRGYGINRSYVIQGMQMSVVTWANDARGKSVFWLHVAVRHGTWPSVDGQLGITSRASSDSSGYTFAAENRVSAAHVPFSGDSPT